MSRIEDLNLVRIPYIIKKGVELDIISPRFKKLTNDLYQFAFVLCPDDLHASQIVLDSVMSANIDLRTSSSDWSNLFLEVEGQVSYQRVFALLVLKKIYQLSTKRLQQLSGDIIHGASHSFFDAQLRFEERATFFLRHIFIPNFYSDRQRLAIDEIADVLEISRVDVMTLLSSSRSKLSHLLSRGYGVNHA